MSTNKTTSRPIRRSPRKHKSSYPVYSTPRDDARYPDLPRPPVFDRQDVRCEAPVQLPLSGTQMSELLRRGTPRRRAAVLPSDDGRFDDPEIESRASGRVHKRMPGGFETPSVGTREDEEFYSAYEGDVDYEEIPVPDYTLSSEAEVEIKAKSKKPQSGRKEKLRRENKEPKLLPFDQPYTVEPPAPKKSLKLKTPKRGDTREYAAEPGVTRGATNDPKKERVARRISEEPPYEEYEAKVQLKKKLPPQSTRTRRVPPSMPAAMRMSFNENSATGSFALSERSTGTTAPTSFSESFQKKPRAVFDNDFEEVRTGDDDQPYIVEKQTRNVEPTHHRTPRARKSTHEFEPVYTYDSHIEAALARHRQQKEERSSPPKISQPSPERRLSPPSEHDAELEEALARQRRDEEELRILMEQQPHHATPYEPGSDEDMLARDAAMQSDFDPFENSARYAEYEAQKDDDGFSDSDFGETSSFLAEFDKLAISVDPVPSPRKPLSTVTNDALASTQVASRPKPPARPFSTFPYFIQYEITRFALALGVSTQEFDSLVPPIAESFADDFISATTLDEFMRTMLSFVEALITHSPLLSLENIPHPMAEIVWQKLHESEVWPTEMEITGYAAFSETAQKVEFDIQLQQLAGNSKTARFSHRFGSDRFMQIRLPTIGRSEIGKLPRGLRGKGYGVDDIRKQTVEWLVDTQLELLGRKWRCFYIRDDSKKRRDKETGNTRTENFLIAFFFAERGIGIGREVETERMNLGLAVGGVERAVDTREMGREDLLMWHMPVEKQVEKMRNTDDWAKRGSIFAKMWSRVTLGLSTSRATVTFSRDQIREVPDIMGAVSDRNPTPQTMNDGCCVCSPAVMRRVRDALDLPETPTAVQGRIGGAKGMWFADPSVDPRSEDIWIQVNDSQLKYPYHSEDSDPKTADWARLTLYVINYSKPPVPAVLNMQLVPILADRGVPFETFKEVLEEHLDTDLEELMEAAQSRIALRYWLQKSGLGSERNTMGWQILQNEAGGFPQNKMEQMAMLVDAGFEPLQNTFLMDRLRGLVEDQVDSVTDHLHIRVPESISVFCIADPTGTLGPGEISMQFSQGFLDTNKNRLNCLEGDVLVARNPAHLPSDIQKVKAVCPSHSGLRNLTDVVVFSTKGDLPLASLLSGGDYDGDKVWICWAPNMVRHFENSRSTYSWFPQDSYFDPLPLPPTALEPDLQHPTFWRSFFARGFDLSLTPSLLGLTTNLLENYAYARHWRIDSHIIKFAKLCGILVDARKQGLVPNAKTTTTLRQLAAAYPDKPAYRTPKRCTLTGAPSTWFLLDRLVFDVAKRKADEKMIRFDELRRTPTLGVDRDLTALFRREESRAPRGSALAAALKRLLADIRAVQDAWRAHMQRPETTSFHDKIAAVHALYEAVLPCAEAAARSEMVAGWRERAREPHAYWRLLRASAAYYCDQNGRFPWWMAGPELCRIKAEEVWFREGGAPARTVGREVYVLLKPNVKVGLAERWRGGVEWGEGEDEEIW